MSFLLLHESTVQQASVNPFITFSHCVSLKDMFLWTGRSIRSVAIDLLPLIFILYLYSLAYWKCWKGLYSTKSMTSYMTESFVHVSLGSVHFKAVNNLCTLPNHGNQVDFIYLDFSKAFDNMSHSVFILQSEVPSWSFSTVICLIILNVFLWKTPCPTIYQSDQVYTTGTYTWALTLCHLYQQYALCCSLIFASFICQCR